MIDKISKWNSYIHIDAIVNQDIMYENLGITKANAAILKKYLRNEIQQIVSDAKRESHNSQVAYKRSLFLQLRSKSKDVLGTPMVTMQDISKVFNRFKIQTEQERSDA